MDAPLPVASVHVGGRGRASAWNTTSWRGNKKIGLTELDRYARTARHSKERRKGVVSGCIFLSSSPLLFFPLFPIVSCLFVMLHLRSSGVRVAVLSSLSLYLLLLLLGEMPWDAGTHGSRDWAAERDETVSFPLVSFSPPSSSDFLGYACFCIMQYTPPRSEERRVGKECRN